MKRRVKNLTRREAIAEADAIFDGLAGYAALSVRDERRVRRLLDHVDRLDRAFARVSAPPTEGR